MSREKQTARGRAAEHRIREELSRYGKVIDSEYGNMGHPDLIFTQHTTHTRYGIECKRLKAKVYKRGVNAVCISRLEWANLKIWGRENEASAIVVVEVYFKHRKPIYFILPFIDVNDKFEMGNGEFSFGFSLWQVIDLGMKFSEFFEGDFS